MQPVPVHRSRTRSLRGRRFALRSSLTRCVIDAAVSALSMYQQALRAGISRIIPRDEHARLAPDL